MIVLAGPREPEMATGASTWYKENGGSESEGPRAVLEPRSSPLVVDRGTDGCALEGVQVGLPRGRWRGLLGRTWEG